MSTVTIDTHILYALLSKASNLGQAAKDLGLDVCTIWPKVDVPLNFVTQLKRCADDLSKIARENDEPGYLEIQRATFPYPPQGRDGRRSRTPYHVDHGRHGSGRYQQFRNTRSESRGYELEDNFNAPGTKVYQRQQVVIDLSAEDGDRSDGSNNAAREQEADIIVDQQQQAVVEDPATIMTTTQGPIVNELHDEDAVDHKIAQNHSEQTQQVENSNQVDAGQQQNGVQAEGGEIECAQMQPPVMKPNAQMEGPIHAQQQQPAVQGTVPVRYAQQPHPTATQGTCEMGRPLQYAQRPAVQGTSQRGGPIHYAQNQQPSGLQRQMGGPMVYQHQRSAQMYGQQQQVTGQQQNGQMGGMIGYAQVQATMAHWEAGGTQYEGDLASNMNGSNFPYYY